MKGCEDCYYEFFDARAYPCSLCIRGIKRTDKWMPKIREKSLKEVRALQDYYKVKDKLQKWTKENCKGCKYNEYPYDSETCFIRVCINGNKYEPQTEPQTERSDK